MIRLLKEIFTLLTNEQKKQFYWLQCLVAVMAIVELVGIASIAPFMALLGNRGLLKEDNVISSLYEYTAISSESDFIVFMGLSVLFVLTISSVLSMYTTWKVSIYATRVGTEIANQLYIHFMGQNWLFHTLNNSADITKKIVNETERLTMLILLPVMILNSRLVLGVFITVMLFLYDPTVAITGFILFGVSYYILFKNVRGALNANGEDISKAHSNRYRLINEGFGGFKDLLLLNRQKSFILRFSESGKTLAHGLGVNNAISTVPRYAVELLAFGTMITLVLVLFDYYEGDLGRILPVLSIYVLAGLKLLPAFQQVYANLAQIKGAMPAYLALRNDIQAMKENLIEAKDESNSIIDFKKNIVLKNVSFTYPEKSKPAVENINIDIAANTVVGFVGPSGSGKSTIIDIILSLIDADDGQLKVDGNTIKKSNKNSWRSLIGYVPQTIFLAEGSICENIAFGIPPDEIELKKVEKALDLAHLTETVSKLENGLDTMVGERGIQLSGGQRQRIGIARALYNDPAVLVFDEATSALDGVTEKSIMDAIQEFQGQKTIIMIAHRLKTVKNCDQIYFVSSGRIVDNGTYSELYENNDLFKKMADHS